jgi:hypothetical protein
MKKSQIQIGHVYVAKVSGFLTKVRITSENSFGGWDAENLRSGRTIGIRSAARLRYELPCPAVRP